MSWLEKCRNREEFRASLEASWGPETEFGEPVRLVVDVELRSIRTIPPSDPGKLELSICADLKVKSCGKLGLVWTDIGGQCLDNAVEHLGKCGLRCRALEELVPIWGKWHLNHVDLDGGPYECGGLLPPRRIPGAVLEELGRILDGGFKIEGREEVEKLWKKGNQDKQDKQD